MAESQPAIKKGRERIWRYRLGAAAGYRRSRDEEIAAIEMDAIRRGGRWTDELGNPQGLGLPHHYKELCKAVWPHIDWHRWTELCNQEIRRPGAKCTVLLGAGSTGKTNVAAWQYLLEYYCFPDNTLVLVSSTTLDGLRRRVWGEIKRLHEMARQKLSWLPGVLTESRNCITTQAVRFDDDDEIVRVRDFNLGLACVPSVLGNKAVGLSKWIGIKQKHIRIIADDCTAMSPTFLSAFSNLNNNEDFQALILGNPDDILDPLGVAAEPKDGWSSHLQPTATEVWDTKFFDGRCINLVGTDSPNFDKNDPKVPYKYLIGPKKISETIAGFGKDSFEYYSQCVGVMKISQLSRRVITRDLCRQFHAMDDAVWEGEARKKIAGLDAAYGGDRCVGGYAEFGKCFDGKIRLQFYPHHIVPVRVNDDTPMAEEDSISDYERDFCSRNNIEPAHFFHDSTGRGSLGTSLSRRWSSACNPVEFGGVPSKRPVTMDTYINDKVTGERRLKRADEHYSYFVSELWYSLRFAIESDQIRGLTQEVIDELAMRNWERVANDKIQVESKIDLKKRIRKSCDLGDWAAIILEGARRLGFQIAKLSPEDAPQDDGLELENEQLDRELQAEFLVHS